MVVTADSQNKVEETCSSIPPLRRAAFIAVEIWSDSSLAPLQDKKAVASTITKASDIPGHAQIASPQLNLAWIHIRNCLLHG